MKLINLFTDNKELTIIKPKNNHEMLKLEEEFKEAEKKELKKLRWLLIIIIILLLIIAILYFY